MPRKRGGRSGGPSASDRGGHGGGRGMRGGGGSGPARATPAAPAAPRGIAAPPPPPPPPPPVAPARARVEPVLVEELEEKASVVPRQVVETPFPARPGFGRAGTRLTLFANHFKVTLRQDSDVYHYDISMMDANGRKFGNGIGLPPKALAEKITRALVGAITRKYKDAVMVTDGRKNLYAARRLPLDEELFSGLDIGETRGPDNAPALFQAVVKAADPVAVRMQQLTALFDGQLNYTPQDALQALDIVLRHTASQRMTLLGRNLYSPRGARAIGEGAECWSGYFQSLRPTQNRLVINLDLAATAFVKAMPVLDYVAEVIRSRDGSLPATLSPSQHVTASKALRGVKVETTHRPGVKRTYRANGLSSRGADQTFFEEENGKRVSVADYFARNYTRLRFPKLPCLHVGAAKKGVHLPLEVCRTVAGQKCPRKTTDRQTAEMIKVARTDPAQRKTRIEQIVRDANFAQDPTLRAYGLSVDPKMVTVEGRQLQAPVLVYSGGKTVRARDGAWRMDQARYFSAGRLESFAVLVLDERLRDDLVKKFFDRVLSQGRDAGLTSLSRSPPFIKVRRARPLRDAFQEGVAAAQRTFGKPAQLIWSVHPFQDSNLYGDLKRASDTEFGIPSQCMLSKHVEKANPQYIGNILLKVNTKLRGVNVKLADAPPDRMRSNTIIFGADVTHPSPGDQTRPSIAAVVGSINPDFTSYAAAIRAQGHRVEKIVNLKDMVMQLLKSYYRSTRTKPANILFYRDGVSEGQFPMVMNYEVTAIREACASIEPGYQPAVTFIIVQKRHHTRFFVANSNDADRSGNTKPGVVVDNGVCHPTEYDFYLTSHAGIQGTSRPTHYHVLLDEIQLTPDELQGLTYRLCYTYARCTRSVSMVPAAYYAHLLAFRARFFTPEGMDSSSGIVSSEVSASADTDMRMLNVHMNLQNVMYYV